MPSRIRSVRAPETDWDAWEAEAASEHTTRNNWIRKTLNDSVKLSKALKGAEGDAKRRRAEARVNRVAEQAYPQSRPTCSHRLMPGVFCKKCGVTK